MRPHNAYNQHKQPSATRIDIIIALYRKALDRLERAARLLADQHPEAARAQLAEVRLIIASFSSGITAGMDDNGLNFVRLYEFALHRLDTGGSDDIAAVRKVLTPLLEGFEAAREQAAALELQGQISSLDHQREIQITA